MVKREGESLDEGLQASKRPPYPKRKTAIMMGYCGTNYQGMQLNPNAKTIELELFKALCEDGLVSKENAIDPKKIAWMRACRTDKGVHAAGQVVSVKMLIKSKEATLVSEGEGEEGGEEVALKNTVDRLNKFLPSDIRIFGIKRTANSFHAKERCDSRFYEYLLPTYALAPASTLPYLNPPPRPIQNQSKDPIREEEQLVAATSERKKNEDSDDEAERLEEISEEKEKKEEPTIQWVSRLTSEEKLLIKDYRIDDGRIRMLKEFLLKYKGNRPFHNFTIGKTASDPSSRRHIFDVIVGDPFIKGDIEWISIVFHGQSFMLHQIRKMVGLAILALRLNCNFSIIDECFKPAKVNIPKAPSLGLLLDKSIFKAYNTKFGGVRDAIEFDEFSTERKELKEQLIYPKIFEEEAQYNRFMGWLKCNDEHGGEFGFLVPFIENKDRE